MAKALFNFTNAAMPTVIHQPQPLNAEQRATFAAQVARVASAIGLNAADQNACVRLGLTHLEHGRKQYEALEQAIVLANRLELLNRVISKFSGDCNERSH